MERVSFESVVTTICQAYGYRLEHIYQRGFRDGGLTFEQVNILFEDYQARLYNQMVFDASLQGIDLNEVAGKKKVESKSTPAFEFQSPEEYKNMPMEARKALTEKMMGKHKLKFG